MICNVLIVGAGAMGCLFAARFAAAGKVVTLVDVDRDRLAGIAGSGLVLRDDGGERRVSPRAALAADVTGPVDLVLLFTKGLHTRAAVESIAHLVSDDPLLLTLQNGVGNGEIIVETFGPGRVLVGTAHVPAELEPPNVVVTHGFAHLHIGGLSPSGDRFAADVAEVLREAGFDTGVSANIHADIWEKLAFNAALNPLAMVAGATNAMMNNDYGRLIARRIIAETVAVASAKGLVIDEAEVANTVDRALAEHGHHKASMLQDREAGRRTEIEFINGAVIREGDRLNVDTSANQMLTWLVRMIEERTA